MSEIVDTIIGIDKMIRRRSELFKAQPEFTVITCEHLTKTKKETINRTFKERFFSFPWRPWIKEKEIYIQVPDETIYMVSNQIICHPAIEAKLIDVLKL